MAKTMADLFVELDPAQRDIDEEIAEMDRRSMSLRINVETAFELEKLAQHLGTTKTGLAQDLLTQAVVDGINHFGLPRWTSQLPELRIFADKSLKNDAVALDVQKRFSVETNGLPFGGELTPEAVEVIGKHLSDAQEAK